MSLEVGQLVQGLVGVQTISFQYNNLFLTITFLEISTDYIIGKKHLCINESKTHNEMHVRLQIVQGILELVTWGSVQRLPHEEGQLVGVLAGGGDPHCAGPVVVKVTQLVGELLDVFRLKPAAVLDHVVGGGIDSSLPHALRHEEEVIPLRQGHHIVHYCAGWRV